MIVAYYDSGSKQCKKSQAVARKRFERITWSKTEICCSLVTDKNGFLYEQNDQNCALFLSIYQYVYTLYIYIHTIYGQIN